MSQCVRFPFPSWHIAAGVALAAVLLPLCPLANAQSARRDNSPPEIRTTNASATLTTNLSVSSGQALPGPNSDLTISPDDVLDISILDVPELSRQYRVAPDGTVVLSLLPEPIKAAGTKVTDFANVVAGELRERGLVSHPHVSVSIAVSRLKAVAVTGAVKMPQIYPVFGRTTLLDILSQAQGLTDDASSIAVISRGEIGMQATDSAPNVLTVDLKKLLETGDPAYNVDVYPGDRVTVPRAGIVYVVGAVNKPGGFPIRSTGDGITVLQAVALAQDLKSTAVRNKAAIIRVDLDSPGGRKQLPLDLKEILSGKAQDPVLQANDILFVPDSQGAKAFRRGLEAALQTATGLAIYGRF
jgi:polysaccharide export outer membrane protein